MLLVSEFYNGRGWASDLRLKNIGIWGVSIFIGVLMGVLCWVYFVYGQFHSVHPPALEVNQADWEIKIIIAEISTINSQRVLY